MSGLITTLAELPFVEREPWSLFGLDPTRNDLGPNCEHDEFGFCRLDAVHLEELGRAITVEHPLILALHAREDPAPLTDDIELEFVLHDDDGQYFAVARLSEFLRRRVPPLLVPRPPAVVLALCNPHRTVLPRHIAPLISWGDLPIYYGHGNVTAWMQRQPGIQTWTPDRVDIILTAERWLRI